MTGCVLVGFLGIAAENPERLLKMTLLDASLVTYLGLFSSGATFWLAQRATAVLTPGAVTAYSYLLPFVSMLLLFIDQPQRIGWHWLPGSLLVILAIGMLLSRAAGRGNQESRRLRRDGLPVHTDYPPCVATRLFGNLTH